MEMPEFLERLRETPRDWFLDRGQIRRRNKVKSEAIWADECPLCSLHPVLLMDFWNTAADLGIEAKLATLIARAADKSCDHDPAIRSDLLAACGLSDPVPSQPARTTEAP